MDVLLLTACFGRQYTLFRPLGSYQIAWYLREFNYSVQVLDFLHKFSEDQIWRLLQKYVDKNTKIIGYAPMINFPDSRDFNNTMEKILLKIRKNFPWIKIVAGGAASQFFIKEYRNKSLFDVIFVGHAEDTMLAYCNHIFQNEKPLAFEKIEGNVVIRENIPLPQIKNKFDIKKCRHSWAENDFIQPGETLPIELGRGCIFSCKFCQYPYLGKEKDDFTREMDLVKLEILENYNKYKTTNYYMVDDTFNANRERTKAFYEMTKELPFKINFSAYLRLDLIATWPEQEKILIDSGLKSCFFGIESLNPDSAKLIGKGWQGKNVKKYLPGLYHDIWNKKVSPRLGFIVGLPPESFDGMKETHQWLVDHELPNWVWEPLFIARDKINTYTSEFDRNAENYGFEFVNDNGEIIWKHTLYNQRQARDFKDQLTNLAKPFQKPSWVQLLELANYGLDVNSFQQQTYEQIDWKPINESRRDFCKNYYLQLLNQKL
jgi:radical SAM superfamily enzyme YgiQ (UPF0313 family)